MVPYLIAIWTLALSEMRIGICTQVDRSVDMGAFSLGLPSDGVVGGICDVGPCRRQLSGLLSGVANACGKAVLRGDGGATTLWDGLIITMCCGAVECHHADRQGYRVYLPQSVPYARIKAGKTYVSGTDRVRNGKPPQGQEGESPLTVRSRSDWLAVWHWVELD